MAEQVTLYTAKICPYAHRAELALEESNTPYTRFEIDLQNKPEWYAPRVNPASKVPAIAYGGPIVAPDDPSPESIKIAESLVLLEFIADISGTLLPTDPVLRAKARFFIDAVSAIQSAIPGIIIRGNPISEYFSIIEKIQTLLPAEGFAIGSQFTIADIALAPFLARFDILFQHDIGAYDEGLGIKAFETLNTDPKFARYRRYFADIKARESFQKTFDAEAIRTTFIARTAGLRAQRQAQAV